MGPEGPAPPVLEPAAPGRLSRWGFGLLAYVVRLSVHSRRAMIFWRSQSRGRSADLSAAEPGESEDLERFTLSRPRQAAWQQYFIWITDFGGGYGAELRRTPRSTLSWHPGLADGVADGDFCLVTIMIAVPFGVYSALSTRLLANAGTFFSVGFSMPTFWLGLILQLVLGFI